MNAGRPLGTIAIGALLLMVAVTDASPYPQTSEFAPVTTARTTNLEFHTSTTSRLSGPLDAQVKAAVSDIIEKNRGAAIVKLRAFAEPADLALVRSLLAKALSEAGVPFPTLSLIGVAGFAHPDQRIAIESTASRETGPNPSGVVFIAGLAAPTPQRTVAGLLRVLQQAAVSPEDMLRISCFYEESEQGAATGLLVASTFMAAEATVVQSSAGSPRPLIECEGVARLKTRHPEPVTIVRSLLGVAPSPNYSIASIVSTPTVVFTGSEAGLGATETDIRAMFERAARRVGRVGARLPDVVMSENYFITPAGRDEIRVRRGEYFNSVVPAATGVFFAGMEEQSASVGMELILAPVNADTSG